MISITSISISSPTLKVPLSACSKAMILMVFTIFSIQKYNYALIKWSVLVQPAGHVLMLGASKNHANPVECTGQVQLLDTTSRFRF